MEIFAQKNNLAESSPKNQPFKTAKRSRNSQTNREMETKLGETDGLPLGQMGRFQPSEELR
eukprot:201711-Pleurochrysis_carterae.AAC.1